jgi:hypothetical protein
MSAKLKNFTEDEWWSDEFVLVGEQVPEWLRRHANAAAGGEVTTVESHLAKADALRRKQVRAIDHEMSVAVEALESRATQLGKRRRCARARARSPERAGVRGPGGPSPRCRVALQSVSKRVHG